MNSEYWTAKEVLDCVDTWAEDMLMVRETGIVDVGGRLDALLVPIGHQAVCMRALRGSYWKRPRVVGVEVKVSRADFLRGLKEGQYERYAKALSGLYIAGPRGVFSTKEIPDYIGILTVYKPPFRRSREHCACVRHPKFSEKPLNAESAWKLLFHLYGTMRQESIERDIKHRSVLQNLGHIAARKILNRLEVVSEELLKEVHRPK
ncbi:MAG: hypothetical protein HS116_24905 [Planctomycetes bacterium]|nr:hypothetical protein [Planctomycetota bacterium]